MKLSFKDCLKLIGSVFVLYLGIHYWSSAAALAKLMLSAGFPLILGGAIAYVVNILMSSYEKRYQFTGKLAFLMKARRPVCLLGAYVTLVAVVVMVVWLVLPQLVDAVQLIIAELPGFISKVLDWVEQWGLLSPEVLSRLEAIDWQSTLNQVFAFVTSGIGSVMDVVVSTVSSVFSGLVTTLVAVIFSVYLLSSKEKMGKQFHWLADHYLKPEWYQKLRYFIWVVDDCFHRYIVGQCIEAVILGSLCALGMVIFKMPYATMVGALTAITALIPVAGAYIGAGVGAFMILTVDPFKALMFLVFIVVLQQLEGNLIYPKVVGSSMGLPGIWVLAAVTVGGGIMGIMGMFLGVPLAAAAYRVIRDDVNGLLGVIRDEESEVLPESGASAE